MVCIYIYSKWKRWWQQTNVPPLQAILMAIWTRWSNTRSIARCSMSTAIPKATGRHHQVTTPSVLLQRLPGQQQTKIQQKHKPTLLAVLMAMAIRWYVTARIAQWRSSRASLEATGCHHRASIMSNNIKGTYLHWFFMFHVVFLNTLKAKGWPQLTIGVWHIKQMRSTYVIDRILCWGG